MNGDGWVSPSDASNMVSELLAYKSCYYWKRVERGACIDFNNDLWLSASDVSAVVSELLPYASNYYWVECPE